MDAGTERAQSSGVPAIEPPQPPRFYTNPSRKEEAELADAEKVEGLEQEIAVLRVRLKEAVNAQEPDLALVLRGMNMLVRAVLAQHRLSPRSNKDLFARYLATINSYRHHLGKLEGEPQAEQPKPEE